MAREGDVPTRAAIAQALIDDGPQGVARLLDPLAPVDRDKVLGDLESYQEWVFGRENA